ERRAADRRRQRRQLHRRARHPDARRPRRRRQGCARRLRADLLLVAGAADLSLHAPARDARLMATVYHAQNTRSMRVLWLLEELGVKAEIRSLPFPPSKLQPDYLSVNPTGTVPTLVDGSVRLTESMAICEYLAAKHNSPMLVEP